MASHSHIEVVEQTTNFTLRELCEHGDVHAEYVIKLVDYGVIEPIQESSGRELTFDLDALARLHKAQRLQRDLKLNVPGLAVSLDLLDDVRQLRREVERLKQQVRQLTQE